MKNIKRTQDIDNSTPPPDKFTRCSVSVACAVSLLGIDDRSPEYDELFQ